MKKMKYTYNYVYMNCNQIDQKLFQEALDEGIIEWNKIFYNNKYNNDPKKTFKEFEENIKKEVQNKSNFFSSESSPLSRQLAKLIVLVTQFYLIKDILKTINEFNRDLLIKNVEFELKNELKDIKQVWWQFHYKIEELEYYCKNKTIIDLIQEPILCVINQSIHIYLFKLIEKELKERSTINFIFALKIENRFYLKQKFCWLPVRLWTKVYE